MNPEDLYDPDEEEGEEWTLDLEDGEVPTLDEEELDEHPEIITLI